MAEPVTPQAAVAVVPQFLEVTAAKVVMLVLVRVNQVNSVAAVALPS